MLMRKANFYTKYPINLSGIAELRVYFFLRLQSSADQGRAGVHIAIQGLLDLFLQWHHRLPGSSSRSCAYSQQTRRGKVKDRVGSFLGKRPERGHIPLARTQAPAPHS